MASTIPPEAGGRLWVVSETYTPELTSTGYFLTGIAEGLARTFSVGAICGQPTYAARGIRAPRHERLNGVEVFRVHGTTFDKNHRYLRLVNAATMTLAAGLEMLARLRRGDVVLVVTNPPTAPYVSRLASWIRGARCVLLVHDVYPDALVAAGMLRDGSIPVRLLAFISRRLLRSMDAICVLGRDMAALIGPRAPRVPVHVTPNWAGDDVIAALDEPINALRQSLGLNDRFVVQYAGNIGGVQDIDVLIRAAVSLRDEAPDVHVLFIGSGRKKAWLKESIRMQHLPNVTVLDERPRAEQSMFLRACDVAVMTFVPGMWGVGVPSRLYNMLASGRPVIAAVDPRSEPALVLEEEQAGWVVPPGDAEALVSAIMQARASADTLKQMGARAALAAKDRYRQDQVLRIYTAILEPFALRRSTDAV